MSELAQGPPKLRREVGLVGVAPQVQEAIADAHQEELDLGVPELA